MKIMKLQKMAKPKKIQGRKKKEEKEKGNHTKYSEDNIMRKIKSHFFNKFNILLNKSIIEKNLKFKRMNSDLNEILKKDYNIALLNKTLKDLYENESISGKFKSEKDPYQQINNKYLIHKIYNENIEIDAINLLNLTFRELFSVFTRNIKPLSPELEMKIQNISSLENDNDFSNINTFFKELEDKAFKDRESIEDVNIYLKNVRNLCINYEKWYTDKKGRNRTSKKDEN